MMEKSALAGGVGGGCTPTPFQPTTITYKVAVYADTNTPSNSSLSKLGNAGLIRDQQYRTESDTGISMSD
jgi:hypothetical protein